MEKQSKVQKRLGKLIRQNLAELFIRELQPEDTIVSVHYVLVTKDLNIANIYISAFPDKKLAMILEFLNSEQGNKEVRKKLASRIRNKVRRVPELRFFEDEIQKEAEKIEKLFEEIHKKPELPEE